jgi:hypothetical protein
VNNDQRYRRLRLLVKRLNKERKKQAKKTDILCNDLVSAQRDFIKRLGVISFAANLYESIVGATDLSTVLNTAGRLVEDEIPGANIAFFLRHRQSFELHMVESSRPITLGKHDLKNSFTSELVDNVCRLNRICTLDDMFAMGLQGNLTKLKEISAATIPLARQGSSLGFILLSCSSQQQLLPDDLTNVTAIAPGLSRAIYSCRMLMHSHA